MATEAARARPDRPSFVLWDWLRQNLFNNWYNSVISVVILVVVFQAVSGFVGWALTAPGWSAAITNLKVLTTWTYPTDQVWRPALAVWIVALLLGLSGGVWRGIPQTLAIGFGVIMLILGVLAFALPPATTPLPVSGTFFLLISGVTTGVGYGLGLRVGEPLRWPLVISWVLVYPVAVLIIRGVGGPLPEVPTNLWGGLMLTMLLSISGIVLSFPLGVLLALGRRSNLPVVKWFCIIYIEFIRGVPLVTVLYMGSLMLPLFLPSEIRIDGVIRAMVAVTLFSAAYLAENVRGGLQSLPKGQAEAARALGLNTVQTTLLITLPQALRAVIPVLVGQFIGLFKDTSLVVIVGLVDLLGAAQNVVGQPQWLGTPGGVWRETFLVIALVYWIFSFTMSRTSKTIEENLSVGHR
ncbi:amino acid ABC transporter permease [Chloroflexales bacterium ZM16-3]|nr:amino acid ABC transporter permease [Chloroflexales bacterium ZM16-3]